MAFFLLGAAKAAVSLGKRAGLKISLKKKHKAGPPEGLPTPTAAPEPALPAPAPAASGVPLPWLLGGGAFLVVILLLLRRPAHA